MAPKITWIHFEFRHMRLGALRKLIFGVHGAQEMFFWLAKKCWIIKLKLYLICQSKFYVLGPWSGHRMITLTSQIVIEKREPQKVQFSFPLVLNKLRSMNWREDLSTLSHILSKALLKVENDILLNMNRKYVTLLVLLDLSAAFDTVWSDLRCLGLRLEFGIWHCPGLHHT